MPRKHLIKMLFYISRLLVTFTLLFFNSAITMAETAASGEKPKSRQIDYTVLQSGGYLGYIAAGVGKDFGSHKLNLLIGYVPKSIGGVEIWQLDFKYDWHPSQAILLGTEKNNIWLDPFYIGISVIYGAHNDLFLYEPDHYPEGYYPSTALRYTLNFGASLKYDRHLFFIEYNILDVGLVAYIKNPKFFTDNYDYLGLEGIGSLAIGVKVEFD